MSSSVNLSSSIRENLLALSKSNAASMATAKSRINTGTKINSTLNDATAYFQARSLNERAAEIYTAKEGLQKASAAIGAAQVGTTSISGLLEEAKGIVKTAATEAGNNASAETLKGYADRYNDVLKKIDEKVAGSSQDGINLLAATGTGFTTIQFGANAGERISLSTKQLDTSEKGLNLQSVTTFGADESARLDSLDAASKTVASQTKTLGANQALVTTRMEFATEFANKLQEGAGKLTLANLNDEGANLVALQTRQQIGVQSLSLAGQQQQAVLSLLR